MSEAQHEKLQVEITHLQEELVIVTNCKNTSEACSL